MKNKHVMVTICPTRVVIEMPKDAGIMAHTVFGRIRQRCDKPLQSWIRDGKKWKPGPQFFMADMDNMRLCVPVYFYFQQLKSELETLMEMEIKEVRADVTCSPNAYQTNSNFKDRKDQIDLLDFVRARKGRRTVIEGDTGFGKTYCAVRIGSIFEETVLIIAPSLTKQWIGEAQQMTDLKEGTDIWEIAGIDSIKKLYASGVKPKMMMASPKTILKYIEYQGEYTSLPTFEQFVRDYGVGTKIIDEAHLGFITTAKIDLSADVRTNIYLSATMVQNNPSFNTIFQMWYPDSIRYVTDLQNPHTVQVRWRYPQLVATSKCRMRGAYSQVAYEKELCRQKFRRLDVLIKRDIIPAIDEFFVKKRQAEGQRCLIFLNNSKTIAHVVNALKDHYGDIWDIRSYCSVLGDPEDNLYDAEIVVTTIAGAGTGKDIKGLITVINLISHASKIWAIQTRGRLRPVEGQLTYMIDMYSDKISAHFKHLKKRVEYLIGRIKDYKIRETR